MAGAVRGEPDRTESGPWVLEGYQSMADQSQIAGSAEAAAKLVADAMRPRPQNRTAQSPEAPLPQPPPGVVANGLQPLPTTEPLGQLRDLLFRHDRQRVAELFQRIDGVTQEDHDRIAGLVAGQSQLTSRVDQLFSQVGTEDRLRHSIARVLDKALREAEISKHRELADAMSPLVIQTIDAQIDQSKPRLIAMLYPEIGRMVAQYVQSAMRDLVENINRKLNGQKPTADAALGVTAGETALAQANGLELVELFLIRRGSAELVQHWLRPGEKSAKDDTLMMRNYLAAIVDYAEAAFQSGQTQLRTVDIGSDRVFFRTSADLVLAARCQGTPPADIETRLDEGFLRVMEQLAQPVSTTASSHDNARPEIVLEPAFPSLAQRIDRDLARGAVVANEGNVAPAGTAKAGGFGRLYGLAAAILLPLAAWIAWTTYTSIQTSKTRQIIDVALKSTPQVQGYPVLTTIDRGGRAYRIEGLVPDAETRQQLTARLQRELPNATGSFGLAVLPEMQRPTADPRGDLERYLKKTAVFFAEGTEFATPEDADRIAGDLARRLRATEEALGQPIILRVIGYTDERGGTQSLPNQSLAQSRAVRFVELLLARGLLPRQLVVVGRTQGFDITSASGRGNANRRIEFELGFTGEPVGQ